MRSTLRLVLALSLAAAGTSGWPAQDDEHKGGMEGDMGARHQMMEKRMDMMGTAMQMMMDRLPAVPAR